MREGDAFRTAIVMLLDTSSSFLPLDMPSTIPCPQPAGQRKVTSVICFFLEVETRLINYITHYTIPWNELGSLRWRIHIIFVDSCLRSHK